MAEILAGPGSRAPPPLPDHLVEEILVRVASPADLARAADFSLAYLPLRQRTGWICSDARDGRVLLIRYEHPRGRILPELAVCDPLTRGYTLLPTIPESLVASDLGSTQARGFTAFFVPAADYEAAKFRVIAWACRGALVVASVYSSLSGTWTDRISISSAGFIMQSQPLDLWPSYAYGCFYWKLQFRNKLLKLDISRMEFSVVVLPPNPEDRVVVVVEAGEGKIGIITRACQIIPELLYSIWQDEIGNDNEHATETAILLPSDYHCYFFGVAEGYIIIIGYERASD